MEFIQEIDLSLRSKATLILVVSAEEERVTEDLKSLCRSTERSCIAWDLADGFSLLVGKTAPTGGRDPLSVLEQIDKAAVDEAALFILHDFHECWANPNIKRKLRGLARKLKYTRKSILITAPAAEIPAELINECVVMDYPLPNVKTLEAVLDKLKLTPGVSIHLSPAGKEKLLQAALGLTASQAQRVFAKAIVRSGKLGDNDIDFVMREKKQLIRDIEAL